MSTIVSAVVTAARRRDKKKAEANPAVEGMDLTAYNDSWFWSFSKENLRPA
jgi:hypothetical protein